MKEVHERLEGFSETVTYVLAFLALNIPSNAGRGVRETAETVLPDEEYNADDILAALNYLRDEGYARYEDYVVAEQLENHDGSFREPDLIVFGGTLTEKGYKAILGNEVRTPISNALLRAKNTLDLPLKR